mgnify:CR=1 FL=1
MNRHALRPLSLKILERPRLLAQLRDLIPDKDRAHLVPYNTTELERDLAIRLGRLSEARLVATRLAPREMFLCAAPAYLAEHGTPAVPEDLERHRFLPVLVHGNGAKTLEVPVNHRPRVAGVSWSASATVP